MTVKHWPPSGPDPVPVEPVTVFPPKQAPKPSQTKKENNK